MRFSKVLPSIETHVTLSSACIRGFSYSWLLADTAGYPCVWQSHWGSAFQGRALERGWCAEY